MKMLVFKINSLKKKIFGENISKEENLSELEYVLFEL